MTFNKNVKLTSCQIFATLPRVEIQLMENRLKNYCVLLLTILLFTQCGHRQESPKMIDGVLDLSHHNFEKTGLVAIKGTANFFWKKLYTSQDFTQGSPTDKIALQIPKIWNEINKEGKKVGASGFGTYHIRIKLPRKKMPLAFKVLTVGTSYKMFVNNKQITEVGKVGTSKETSRPEYRSLVVDFQNPTKEIDLFIQVSNFHYRYGGIWQQITLGLEKPIRKQRERYTIIDFFLVGSIFIMGLYHLGLFLVRHKNHSALYFGLCCLLASVRLLVTNEYLVHHFMTNDWFVNIRLEYFTLHAGPLVFFWFFYSLFPQEFSRKIFIVLSAIFGLLCLSNIFLPPYLFSQALPFSQLMIMAAGLYCIFGLIKAAIRKREGAKLFIMGFMFLFGAVINDILYANYIINTGHQFGTGLFLFIFSQAFVLSYRFSRTMNQNEVLAEELNYTNKNLEKLVDERTNELKDSNERLNQYVEELDQINHVLSSNNEIIQKKNKDITDSINYASNIQKALLPLQEDLEDAIPNHFIFYRPRDIVSGDFYWFTKIVNPETKQTEKILFAVVDCTGHGVPGAFMSMLGIEGLNNVVNRQKTLEPEAILTQLHEYISITLRKRLNNLRDGMDIALAVIDIPKKQVSFAGAHNPLILVQNNSLQLIKGSALSIGGFIKNKSFKQHTLSLEGNSTLYLFTDGFQDQFGGSENRKFMKSRLRELLLNIHHQPMSTQQQILQETIEDWMTEGNEKQIDDILVVGLKFDF